MVSKAWRIIVLIQATVLAIAGVGAVAVLFSLRGVI